MEIANPSKLSLYFQSAGAVRIHLGVGIIAPPPPLLSPAAVTTDLSVKRKISS